MKDLVEDIENIIQEDYEGHLFCNNCKEDLFVYVDGKEEQIKSISTDTIYFNNSYVELLDADIQHLVYILDAINK